MLEMHTNEATHKSSPFLKIKIHKNFSSLLEWVFTKCKCVRRVNTNWLQDSDQIFWTIGEGRLTPIRGGEQHSPWWHRTRAPTSWLAGSHKGHIKASAPPHRAQSPGCCWRPSSSSSPSPPPPPQTPGLRQYCTLTSSSYLVLDYISLILISVLIQFCFLILRSRSLLSSAGDHVQDNVTKQILYLTLPHLFKSVKRCAVTISDKALMCWRLF